MGRVNLTPALGLIWSNCVNTRYYLTNSEITVRTERDKENPKPFMGQSIERNENLELHNSNGWIEEVH